MRDSFVFYRSFADAVEFLPADQYKEVMAAVCRYALDEAEPENLSGVCNAIFTLIRPQIDANNKRRANGMAGAKYGVLGGRPKTPKKPQENPKKTPNSENETPNVNVNVNDNKRKEIDKEKKRFVKPTVADISEYCRERGNRVNPQRFYDYYESKGWLVGKSHMKDWKACVRTWEQRDSAAPDRHGTQREDDLDAMLIKQIIGRGANNGD